MRVPFFWPALLAALLLPRMALPCGLCHEDNRAAVYSYEAMKKVKADPQRLEFAVFKLTGPLPKAGIERLQLWLGQRPGIDKETIKISSQQKSMGFVWEKSHSKPDLILELQRQFPDLKVHSLVYEDPA
ncbi:MAG TPA: hypothetical protein VJP40_04395 [bacterium]|nr:hypothetical protein [bacterium]